MSRFIFDLETNGYLDETTTIHCAVFKDIDTGTVHTFDPGNPIFDREAQMAAIRKMVEEAELLVGNNCIKFDVPVLRKLFPGIHIDEAKIIDTMVLARLVFSDIKPSDYKLAAVHRKAMEDWKERKASHDYQRSRLLEFDPSDDLGEFTEPVPVGMTGKLVGKHSLKAWGIRLGNYKGEYEGGFDAWSQDMHDYMVQDGEVTFDLYRHLMAEKPSEQSVALEHRVAWLCAKIERNGWPFDMEKAAALYAQLTTERETLRVELVGLFPAWKVRLPDFIPKRNNRTKGYVAGVPVERWKHYQFNPASRDHIANRLIAKYGWKPTQFTEKGKPQIDDEVLSDLPYPEAKPLARFFLLEKRISQLAEGDQAWMRVCKNGKIHGAIITNGTVTGRASHAYPNIAQVPRVGTEFGRECRELFVVPEGWVLVGADQSGLELRCLAADLSHFDRGRYIGVVCEGDVHTTNQEAAGLTTRNQAKTFIYAFLYGAGNAKLGLIAGGGTSRGKLLKETFLKRTPGLKKLINYVKGAAKKGWIKGLDKRRIPIRSDHAALNSRLQHVGAVICKQWICDLEDALLAKGLKHGWDGDFAFVGWVHDEVQIAVREGLQDVVAEIAVATARKAGEPFGFGCPLDGEAKVGLNWAETH